MKNFLKHSRKYVLRGLLTIIPLALTVFVLRLLYLGIDQRVMGLIARFIGFNIPGLGLLIILVLLYLIGFITSNVVGLQIFHFLEQVTKRIPLVNTTYQVGKQLSNTLALPERQVFKRAVLMEFLKSGMWTVGFVTGTVIDRRNNNDVLLKVYVPTPPMPASGTLILVRESQTRDPGWSVEDALKVVISGGIIGPPEVE